MKYGGEHTYLPGIGKIREYFTEKLNFLSWGQLGTLTFQILPSWNLYLWISLTISSFLKLSVWFHGLYSSLVSIWPCFLILLFWVCSLKFALSRTPFLPSFLHTIPVSVDENKYSWSQLPWIWLCLWNLHLLQTWLINTAQAFIWVVSFLAWKPHWDFELIDNQVMIYILKPVIPLCAFIQWKKLSPVHLFFCSFFLHSTNIY